MSGVAVLAVDPGTTHSAWCRRDGDVVVSVGIVPNGELLDRLRISDHPATCPVLVIEDVQSYGMAVGRDVFRTCMWAGGFATTWGGRHVLLPRREVKLTLCGTARAKDANVRQAVIDRLGPLPTKAAPNPAYGPRRPSSHEWSALALALTYEELVKEGRASSLETLNEEVS